MSFASTVEAASNGRATATISARALNTSDEFLHSVMFMLSKNRYRALLIVPKSAKSPKFEIARWSQDNDGYPVKIGVATDEYICPDKSALTTVLARLLTTAQVGAAIRSFSETEIKASGQGSQPKGHGGVHSVADQIKNLQIKGEVIEQPFGVSSVYQVGNHRAAATAKLAAVKPAAKPTVTKAPAKPVAKPAVKKAAAKPAVKPVAKKAAAKPEAKPVAKKAAAKPAAKPVANKAAAKPAVKPAAKKAAAKPAVKSAANKAAAKPATKPAAKKVAEKPALKKAAATRSTNLAAGKIKAGFRKAQAALG